MPFRPAGPPDLEIVLSLMRDFYSEDGHVWDDAAARGALGRLLDDPSCGRAFVLEHAGGTAGYLVVCFGFSLEFHGRDAFVDELYVVPEARGHGHGREALRVAETCCRENGVRALHLEVGRDNEKARRLYRTWGFEERAHTLMSKRLP